MTIHADTFITAYYLVSAGLCVIAALVFRRRGGTWLEVAGWLLLASGLLALTLLDALGLEGTAADAGREAARQEGWYWHRREVQGVVVGLLGLGFGLMVLLTFIGLRGQRIRNPVMVSVVLACFVAVRTVSLHHVDRVLYGEYLIGFALNDFIEGVLSFLVGVTVAYALVRYGLAAGQSRPTAAARAVQRDEGG